MDFSQDGKEPDHTGFDVETLKNLVKLSVDLPEDFTCHPRLRRFHIGERLKSVESGRVDWATAEAIALGSLNLDGYNTRLVGEDSERGTFSQRHAVLADQQDFGRRHTPLL